MRMDLPKNNKHAKSKKRNKKKKKDDQEMKLRGRIKGIIFPGLICIQLIGCDTSNTIEKKIASKVDHCNHPCNISLTDIAEFKWDRMYVFNLPTSIEEINQATGIDYSKHYVEFSRPMIFFYRDSLVYYENNPSSIEGVVEGQIIFGRGTDTEKFKIFTIDNLTFKANKKHSANRKSYYELIPVKP